MGRSRSAGHADRHPGSRTFLSRERSQQIIPAFNRLSVTKPGLGVPEIRRTQRISGKRAAF